MYSLLLTLFLEPMIGLEAKQEGRAKGKGMAAIPWMAGHDAKPFAMLGSHPRSRGRDQKSLSQCRDTWHLISAQKSLKLLQQKGSLSVLLVA